MDGQLGEVDRTDQGSPILVKPANNFYLFLKYWIVLTRKMGAVLGGNSRQGRSQAVHAEGRGCLASKAP